MASSSLDNAGSPRLAVVGISLSGTCGVRDHARLLAQELEREGIACTSHWLQREQRSLRGSRAEIRAWSRQLAAELAEHRVEAVLLHYSVFSYSYKGLPLFVRPVLAALRAARAPVIGVLHEFAYPWMYGGWRGAVWAVSQRAILVEVMRASAAAIVTADFRASWLASRPWLARRPVLVAPVFSNLPPPSRAPVGERGTPTPVVGLFGYSYQGAAVALVIDAVRELKDRGLPVKLSLLGAPGPASAAAAEWSAAAGARGVADAISFSGALPAQELSDALAACDVLLFADTAGPSPRKGTLAGALASGAPVVAIDGPRNWPELIGGEAVRMARPTAASLADAIAALLSDDAARRALGARGRSFAEREMGVARTAAAVRTLLDELRVTHPR